MKVIKLYIFLFCLNSISGYGQQKSGSDRVAIGDTMQWLHHINVERACSLEKLDVHSKFIVLDFWNIWCSSCIADMPYLDSLQKLFQNNLEIVLVTRNSKDQVEKLFKRKNLALNHLHFVYADSIFYNLFPHKAEPTHVWINKDKRLDYVSFDYNTTFDNLFDWVNGKKLNISLKKEYISFDENNDLFSELKVNAENYLEYSSTWAKYLYEITPSNRLMFSRDNNEMPFAIKAINITPYVLLEAAFSDYLYGFPVNPYSLLKNNRILIRTKKPRLLFGPGNMAETDEWRKQNLISYELIMNKEQNQTFYNVFRRELASHIPYHYRISNLKRKCYVLFTEHPQELKSRNPDNPKKVIVDGHRFAVESGTIKDLLSQMVYKNSNSERIFVDSTHIDFKIDLNIKCDFTNIGDIKTSLQSVGINLIEKELYVPFLIVTD